MNSGNLRRPPHYQYHKSQLCINTKKVEQEYLNNAWYQFHRDMYHIDHDSLQLYSFNMYSDTWDKFYLHYQYWFRDRKNLTYKDNFMSQ